MKIFTKIKKKIAALFRHEKKATIEFDPIKEHVDMLRLVNPGLEDIPDEVIIQEITSTDRMIRFHLPSKDGRIEHLAQYARTRRVRKKNQRRLSMRENR